MINGNGVFPTYQAADSGWLFAIALPSEFLPFKNMITLFQIPDTKNHFPMKNAQPFLNGKYFRHTAPRFQPCKTISVSGSHYLP